MRKLLALLSIAAAVVLPTQAFAVKVLVNSWDGSAYVVVRPLYANDKLPNLKSLGALGQMTSVLPCGDDGDAEVWRCMAGVTKDQHATLLTGKDATVHGVWSNGVFGLIPQGLTIYETLRSKVQGIKMAHLAGKCGNVGPETFGNAARVVNVFAACRDGKEGNFEPAELAARAAALIAEWEAAGVKNWFVFVHFGEPDATGHRDGVNSEEYRTQLRNDDKQLGVMLESVPPEAEVFVLSDHGFGTFEYPEWTPSLDGHNSHTPGTFYVRRGATTPQRKYIDQMMAVWLELFKPEFCQRYFCPPNGFPVE